MSFIKATEFYIKPRMAKDEKGLRKEFNIGPIGKQRMMLMINASMGTHERHDGG